MKALRIFLVLLSFVVSLKVYTQEETPSRSLSQNPTSFAKYVVDETGTLSQAEINILLKKLEDFDKQTSTQIVVYMINTLDGESIEDVSHTIAEKNKIGQKGKDNGVLVLIAKNDRKLRIEVGYGLEGVLTDAYTTQIRTKEMNPYFKEGKFFEGINRGVDAIIAVTKGEYTADKKKQKDNGTCCFGIPIFIVIIFGFIGFSIIMSILSRIFGWKGSTYTGGKHWGGGGFFGGGSSGWGGGSSSGGFGGFSGGGGSFGGGGSSGSW